MCLNVPISLMIIFILIFLISIFDKIFFKNFLSINDMMHSEFTHIITLFVNKIKNIIKITKCHFLKASSIFDVFSETNSIIRQLEFTKYVVSSIFFCSLMLCSFSLIKIIIKLIIIIINAFWESMIRLIFLILFLQIFRWECNLFFEKNFFLHFRQVLDFIDYNFTKYEFE